MKQNTKNKIIIIFAAALVFTNVLNLLFISSILKKDYNAGLHSELLLVGDNLKTQLQRITSLGLATQDIEGFSQQCMELVRKNEHLKEAMIVDRQGTIVFHNIFSNKGKTLEYSRIRESIQTGMKDVFSVSEDNQLYYYAVLPYGDNPGYSNEYAVVICSSSDVINTRILSVIKNCALIIILISVISTAILFAVLSFFVVDSKQSIDCPKKNDESGNEDISQSPTEKAHSNFGIEWIWEVDMNGLYTYSSPEVQNLLGYKPLELVGKKHFYDLFLAHERETMKVIAFERFAEKLPFEDFLNANMHKNGQIVWLMTRGTPIIDEEGCLIGYRGTDVNISERKEYIPAVVQADTDCTGFSNGADLKER
ncbi:MAG: hypothetical protein A2Y10_01745 [Planctomycetes bacterium GWF2_41_51]|nr:MAG: hypothetical protein A2Y10_01745 [Planctomycetes bacterium GWF2_41_51]